MVKLSEDDIFFFDDDQVSSELFVNVILILTTELHTEQKM